MVQTLAVREKTASASLFRCLAIAAVSYFELTKPRVTALVSAVTVAGFWLGSRGAPDALRLMELVWGVTLLAGGIFALNQYMERDLDARMSRTASRPLPGGRLRPASALAFGVLLSGLAIVSLTVLINPLSGLVGLVTLVAYLLVYTPLKIRTPHCTSIGAFPGAMPPVLGWAAARGELNVAAVALFAILFFWQFPHFHSIAWLYRDDYGRAGIRLWPVVEPNGRTAARHVVIFTLLLLPASLLPSLLGVSGRIYFYGAAALGILFLLPALRMARLRTTEQARSLLLMSVVYLPALFALMVLDKG